MAEYDAKYDSNNDGVVTQEEVNSALNEGQPKTPWLAWLAAASSAVAGNPAGLVAVGAVTTADTKVYNDKANQVRARFANNPATTETDVASTVAAASVPTVAGEGEGTGYLGLDELAEAGAVATETLEDGSKAYIVQTAQGPRQALYKDTDPVVELQRMSQKDRIMWRRQMWLGGYMDPKSFVGPLTKDDLAAMKEAMTEANLDGVSWQDAISTRANMGARYGRPMTEAEIMELDDDLPGLVSDYASKNGIDVDSDFIARQQKRVLNGKDTTESVIAKLRDTYVKTMYPQFAQELDHGLTISDIAKPYIDTAAGMLGIPADQLNIKDPIIQQGIGSRGKDGQPVRKTMWEFQNDVMNDPRWQYSDNAYDMYSNAVGGAMREMGL